MIERRIVQEIRGLSFRSFFYLILSSLLLPALSLAASTTVHLSLGTEGYGARAVKITPDGRRVVYQYTWGAIDSFSGTLFSVPVESGASVTLNDIPGFGIYSYAISPDGERVVFRGHANPGDAAELYSTGITGGPVVKISGAMCPGGNVWGFVGNDVITPYIMPKDIGDGFRITSDSKRVIYQADQDTRGVIELYSTPIEGGPATKINDPLTSPTTVASDSFRLSPDGKYVFYSTYEDNQKPGPTTIYHFKVFCASLETGGNREIPGAVSITPDSRKIIYSVSSDSSKTLYCAPISGGNPTALDLDVDGPGLWTFKILPDSSAIIVFQERMLYATRVVRIPLSGDSSVTLASLPAGKKVSDSTISADGAWMVVYTEPGLYSVPTSGGNLATLTESECNFQITPDSRQVLYVAKEDFATTSSLYVVPIEGGAKRRLNAAPEADGHVQEIPRISGDSKTVAYTIRAAYQEYMVLTWLSSGASIRLREGPFYWGFFYFVGDNAIVYSGSQDLENVAEREVYSFLFSTGASGWTNYH